MTTQQKLQDLVARIEVIQASELNSASALFLNGHITRFKRLIDRLLPDGSVPEDWIEGNEPRTISWYRERARERYAKDGEIEIDDDAMIMDSDDSGEYVQAYVWVDDLVDNDRNP